MSLSYTSPPPAKLPAKPHQGYARILGLGEERVLILNNMLSRGDSPFAVARVIQQQWGELQDVRADTLSMQLRRYAAANIIVAPASADDIPTYNLAPAYARLAVGSHMIEMVMEQRERILAMRVKEKAKDGKFSRALKAEIETYMAMLAAVQKHQFDMGIDEYQGPARVGGSMAAAKINPDGSVSVMAGQVVEATARARETLTKHGVTLDAAPSN